MSIVPFRSAVAWRAIRFRSAVLAMIVGAAATPKSTSTTMATNILSHRLRRLRTVGADVCGSGEGTGGGVWVA